MNSTTLMRPSLVVGLGAAAAVLMATTANGLSAPLSSAAGEDRLRSWENRWNQKKTGWHRNAVNPILEANLDRFIGGSEKRRIMVPLCGKTVDLAYLAKKGHEVVGVEGVERAVMELQNESWLDFTKGEMREPGGEEESKAYIPSQTFQGAKPGYIFTTRNGLTGYYKDVVMSLFQEKRLPLSIVCGDMFLVTPELVGEFDRVWDRASLVAIEPNVREEYVDALDRLLIPGGVYLLHVMEEREGGPPYAVSPDDVKALFGPKGYKIEVVDRRPGVDPNFENMQAVYLMTKPTRRGLRFWLKPWRWFSS